MCALGQVFDKETTLHPRCAGFQSSKELWSKLSMCGLFGSGMCHCCPEALGI